MKNRANIISFKNQRKRVCFFYKCVILYLEYLIVIASGSCSLPVQYKLSKRRKPALKDDYLITLHTVQETDGDKDIIEMTARASLRGEGDDYYITYTDEDGDLEGCVTTLHVENGSCITISRNGSYNSHMIVEKNVRHISHHTTPYGSFSLGVSALNISSKMKRSGGTLDFRYCTDIDMHPLGEIQFNIKLEQCRSGV